MVQNYFVGLQIDETDLALGSIVKLGTSHHLGGVFSGNHKIDEQSERKVLGLGYAYVQENFRFIVDMSREMTGPFQRMMLTPGAAFIYQELAFSVSMNHFLSQSKANLGDKATKDYLEFGIGYQDNPSWHVALSINQSIAVSCCDCLFIEEDFYSISRKMFSQKINTTLNRLSRKGKSCLVTQNGMR